MFSRLLLSVASEPAIFIAAAFTPYELNPVSGAIEKVCPSKDLLMIGSSLEKVNESPIHSLWSLDMTKVRSLHLDNLHIGHNLLNTSSKLRLQDRILLAANEESMRVENQTLIKNGILLRLLNKILIQHEIWLEHMSESLNGKKPLVKSGSPQKKKKKKPDVS
jgi:hypothetical protein